MALTKWKRTPSATVRVLLQSVAAESKKLDNKRRALAAKRKKLEAEEAALYDQEESSGEEDK